MACSSQISLLLSLPQELRTKIYEELLCPEHAKVYTLWHDREGRQGPFGLHPSILRANKQIYHEAVSVLYENNILEIDLTTPVSQVHRDCYEDGKPDPPPLFQRDGNYASSQANGEPRGIIQPRSFRLLRLIKLRIRKAAIWGWDRSERKCRLSAVFWLIERILRELGGQQDVNQAVPHTLEITVVPDWRTKYGIFGAEKSDAPDATTAVKILELIQGIKMKRAVSLEERIKPSREDGGFQPLKREVVDVDARLTQLRDMAPGHS